MSIFDSIGDYYACAKVSRVPAPPLHAVNRGILIEGICTFFSGTFGCGHATSTYGGNIGAIGLTKVRALISLSLSPFLSFYPSYCCYRIDSDFSFFLYSVVTNKIMH